MRKAQNPTLPQKKEEVNMSNGKVHKISTDFRDPDQSLDFGEHLLETPGEDHHPIEDHTPTETDHFPDHDRVKIETLLPCLPTDWKRLKMM